METMEPGLGQTTTRVRTTVFVLIFAHLALSWLAPAIILAPALAIPIAISIARAFFLGLILSQMTLLAVWMAFGSDPLLRRLLSCCVVTVSIFFAALTGGQAMGDEFSIASSPVEVILGGLLFVVGIAIMQVPFWFVGHFWECWELQAPWKEKEASTGPKQFPLSFLIGVTAGFAMVLSIGRLLIPADALSALRDATLVPMVSVMQSWALFLTGNMIVVLPCIRSSLAERPAGLLILTLFLCLAWAVVAPLSVGSFGLTSSEVVPLLVLNIAQCVSIFVSLRVLRHVGFRLIRTSSPK